MKKYSVKEIIEMKKNGIHDDVIGAIVKFHWEVDTTEVVELQNNFDEIKVVEFLKDMNGSVEVVSTVSNVGKVPTGSGAFSTNVKDYEPKKQDNNYHWGSYKAKCKAYCYAVASKGVTNCYKKDVVDFDSAEFKDAYDKAKAEFKATFKYIKKSDR